MPSPELVIFDCDGVLVDSEIIAARAEAEMLAKAGFEITPEDLARDYAGLTFRDILLRIEKEEGRTFQANHDRRSRGAGRPAPGQRGARHRGRARGGGGRRVRNASAQIRAASASA
jgi:beta-phosphoglucomutase-like phosphatase (HAD superfamily)